MTRKGRRSNSHPYPRTARLNELVREIVADELERIDDERLDLVTVISVDVDATLHQATVFVDSPYAGTDDSSILEALGDHRKRLQGAIGRQARIKRTPELLFEADEVQRTAARLDSVLRNLHATGGFGPEDEAGDAVDSGAATAGSGDAVRPAGSAGAANDAGDAADAADAGDATGES